MNIIIYKGDVAFVLLDNDVLMSQANVAAFITAQFGLMKGKEAKEGSKA